MIAYRKRCLPLRGRGRRASAPLRPGLADVVPMPQVSYVRARLARAKRARVSGQEGLGSIRGSNVPAATAAAIASNRARSMTRKRT